jgi:hypothetical protein
MQNEQTRSDSTWATRWRKTLGHPFWPWQKRVVAKEVAREPSVSSSIQRFAICTLSLLALTAVHGARFYDEPQLAVGQIAPATILAPYTSEIIDPVATEAEQDRLRTQMPQVLQIDRQANGDMAQALQEMLRRANISRQERGAFPYLDTSILSSPVQQYLWQLPPDRWQYLRTTVVQPKPEVIPSSKQEQAAVLELRRFYERWTSDPSDPYANVLATIDAAQARYRQASLQLEALRLPATLLPLEDSNWTQLEGSLSGALQRLQAIGIAPGLPEPLLRQGTMAQLDRLSPELQPIATDLLVPILRSNLQVDRQHTQAQMQTLLAALEPVTVQVMAGDPIAVKGQQIDQRAFTILDGYGLAQRHLNPRGLLLVAAIVGGAIAVFVPLQSWIAPSLRNRDRLLLLFLVCTAAPVASSLGVQYTSLLAVGLLVGSYYGAALGLTVVVGTALLLPLATTVTLLSMAPVLASSLLTCTLAHRPRSREELALLGGGAAFVQMAIYALLGITLHNPLELGQVALTGGAGLLWSIVALGASPNIEPLFDLVTPIRLAELANPNRPLLRRLATEAPGTFQHTLFVASLAERAAQHLKLNAELVRTGTLYHDIGKMLHADYFIENQMGGPNPHDTLNDPYESAQIIKAHVTDGIKMARQYRLPTAIRAFIPEHQGTIRIAYFYHQAQLREPDRVPEEEAFRYDGPIPQTPETGVVMLADACEAALRSLWRGHDGNAQSIDLEEVRQTILRIFRSRWKDCQLKDCGLSKDNLKAVADVFVQVWRESYHERIRYPSPLAPSGSVR